MKIKIISAVLAVCMMLSMASCGAKDESSSKKESTKATTTTTTTAATEAVKTEVESEAEEEPQITLTKSSLEYWAEDSAVREDLIDYVEKVTDPDSEDFIPVEDRIAVFDFDGTLIGELYPCYFDWCLFVHRALHDDSYQAPEDMKAFAEELEEAFKTRTLPEGSEIKSARFTAQAFAGMTVDEFRAYCRDFMNTEAEGFNNLTKGEAYYKPMVSLFKFLQDNDFTCFICSGTERNCIREMIQGVLDIPASQVIATDWKYVGTEQGDTDPFDYQFKPDEKLVFAGELITKNVKGNKVPMIAREIGQVPVLAFGNSSGDLSMGQYVVNSDKYDTRAYMLLCDDTEREYGNLEKAEKFKKTCEELGFTTVSMKNDFATIYGDDVTITAEASAADAA